MIASPATIEEPVGTYLRVSDDAQEIDTQRKTIRECEVRYGVTIAPSAWYIDQDWSRDETDRRPDWLRMLADVDAGKLRTLLITAKDRFGTASGRRKVLFYARLWDAGCKLILANTGEVLNAPSLASDLNALVDGDTEERELREKSNRALDKMRHHHKAGRWMGGTIPFGLDVVCVDMQGGEKWRVYLDGPEMRVKISPDGSRKRYDGPDNFPGRDAGQVLTLRPTKDPHRLGIPSEVFTWFDSQALSTYQIAARLNDRGEPHPSGAWTHDHIETMLRNPAYLGIPVWNRTSRAKWNELTGGEQRRHEEVNRQTRKHGKEDWIQPPQMFEPIVDTALFDRVQAKLGARSTSPRSPKSVDLWLSGGLLVCGHCGANLQGTVKQGVPTYVCGSYLDRLQRATPSRKKRTKVNVNAAHGCPYLTVKHIEAEGWVRSYLDETMQLLPTPPRVKGTVVSAAIQSAWHEAIVRLVEAQTEMRNRVIEWARNADERTLARFSRRRKTVELDAAGKMKFGPHGEPIEVDGEPSISVTDAYRAIFTSERDQLQARLDQLDTEHTNLSLAITQHRSERARAKVQTRIDELDEEISDLERCVANAADGFAKAKADLDQLLTDWEAATNALSSDIDARSRAAAVQKVIGRIVVTWAETGFNRPKYYVAGIKIEAKGGDGSGIERGLVPPNRWIKKSRRRDWAASQSSGGYIGPMTSSFRTRA